MKSVFFGILVIFLLGSIAFAEEHTLQAKLTINATGDFVYVPGIGNNEIETKDYNSTKPYLASFNPVLNLAYAIIGIDAGSYSIGTINQTGKYSLKLSHGGKTHLVFTKGPLTTIQERAEKVFSGSKIGNFGHDISELFKVTIGTSYGSGPIIINGSGTIYPGEHTLTISEVSKGASNHVIEIKAR